MSPAPVPSNSGVHVLRPLAGDERFDTVLARVPGFPEPLVLRVLKARSQAEADAFAQRARALALASVSHPALRPLRGAGQMPDGRAYLLADFVDAPSLAEAGPLLPDSVVPLGIMLADALAEVHAAGLRYGGALPATEVLLGPPPQLDLGLTALSPEGSDPVEDVHALARLLLTHGASGLDRGPFETGVRRALEAATTAAELSRALAEVQSTWRARTAVSGKFQAFDPHPAEVDLTGTALGPWVLERVLGEGAMGRVYLGRHQRIGREAAVKVLKAEHARSADLVQRFIQEATAVNAIKNEHIVEVSDFGEQPQEGGPARVYCVMELLHGRSLADAMDQERFAVQRAVKVCQAIARALHAAHQVGVVHRDVKPENIFLHQKGPDGEFVKVLDFGVAKLLKPIGDIPRSGTQAGIVIGTPEYMAPEQALGSPTDFRVDLYAVGVVLYELLAGHRPYAGDTFGKLVVELTTRPVPPLPARTSTGDAIPAGLAQVVLKCLSREPDARYESAEALAVALEPFAYSGRTVMSPAAPPLTTLPDALIPPLNEVELHAAVKPTALPRVLGALAALAVAGALAFALWPAPPPPAPLPPTPETVVAPPLPLEPPHAVAPARVFLEVATTPPGATVRQVEGDVVLGVTPLKVELAPRPTLPLRVELEGYAPVQKDVPLGANVALQLDLEKVTRVAPALEPKKPVEPKKKGPVNRDRTVDPFSTQ